MKSDCYKWATATCTVEPWCVPQNVIAKLPNPSFEAVPLLEIIILLFISFHHHYYLHHSDHHYIVQQTDIAQAA